MKSEGPIKRIRIDDWSELPESNTDWERVDAMTDEEVIAAALADPDCQPSTPEQLARMRRRVDIKALRARLGLTQDAFAEAYEISPATLRDWEQLRVLPDQAARTYLRVIAADPEGVRRALKTAANQ